MKQAFGVLFAVMIGVIVLLSGPLPCQGQAAFTSLDGDWIWIIEGEYAEKGAAKITFDGSNISGSGFLFSYGDAFFLASTAEVTIDNAKRKITGSFDIVTSGTSPTTIGTITIKKGTFNKQFKQMTIKAEFVLAGSTTSVGITFHGHRFDAENPHTVDVPEGSDAEASINGGTAVLIKSHSIDIVLERSSLGGTEGRFGTLSGGGPAKLNYNPFNLEISDSLFFITDTGAVYGKFESNLNNYLMTGTVIPTKKGISFVFKLLVTAYEKVTIKGIADPSPQVTEFTIPATSNSLTVPILTFTASDNKAVTGYLVTATSTVPSLTATGWTDTADAWTSSGYTFTTSGTKTLYAWAKDADGNVSASKSATVTIDITAPTVTAFVIPSISDSLSVPISTFTATDNTGGTGVTGYIVTESATAPDASVSGWSATAPTSYTFPDTTTNGLKTLYAWAKDAVGNVSTSRSATVTITLPVTP